MIKQIINMLRRDDERLEPLRREVQQQEQPVDWDKLHMLIVYILAAVSMVGLAFMFTVLWTAT